MWFAPQWHKFLLGAIVCYAANGTLRVRTAVTCLAALVVALLIGAARDDGSDWVGSVGMWVGAATAALLLWAARRGTLYDWLSWRPLLFVGTISYSLYLVHAPVISVILGLQKRLAADSPAVGIALFVLCFPAAVAAAWVSYQLVERPSLHLAAHFRPGGRRKPGGDAEALAGGIEGPLPASN